MSVPNDYDIIVVTGSDAEIRVDIPWEYTNISELFVWQQDDVSGVVYYFNLGDFTVVENSDQTGKYILVEKIPSAVGAVTINTARETPKTQTYDLVNSQPLDPVALIEALDKSIKLIQETSVEFAPDNQIITSVNPFTIPDKVERAGKILAFDDNGDVNVTTSDEALDNAIASAEAWAINPEDNPIPPSQGGNGVNTFSSLHWSAKSEGHAGDSESSATASANSASASASSASDSANSATDSQNSATASASSALDSSNSADLAERWADEDEDVPVENGKYSARHWALKAQGVSSIVSTGSNANGKYRVWSDGSIEMWGRKLNVSNGVSTHVYPISWVNGNDATVITGVQSTSPQTGTTSYYCEAISLANFTIVSDGNSQTKTRDVYWYAIGS